MDYTLTQHAEERMRQRMIERAWLEQALFAPARVEPDEIDPSLEHRLTPVAEAGGRVLRVVCDGNSTPLRVIPMHFDRKLKGTL